MENVKLNYNEVKATAKALGLDTTGKAVDIQARIDAHNAAQAAPKKGRPVNPDSARQARLAVIKTGERGRPANPESAWFKKQAALAAKREAGDLKLGRPVNTESARQKRLALKGKLPLGRPKAVKVEEPVAAGAVDVPTTTQE